MISVIPVSVAPGDLRRNLLYLEPLHSLGETFWKPCFLSSSSYYSSRQFSSYFDSCSGKKVLWNKQKREGVQDGRGRQETSCGRRRCIRAGRGRQLIPWPEEWCQKRTMMLMSSYLSSLWRSYNRWWQDTSRKVKRFSYCKCFHHCVVNHFRIKNCMF